MDKNYKSIYFVGAGGIGMAALERYFLARGLRVAGYDLTRTQLTDALVSEGVEICFDEAAALIPDYCKNPADTLVVYTPAIPASHEGLNYFRNGGFTVMKRAELLGLITRSTKGLCFSGTHGKTTTSSMAAHILHCSEIGCNAFLGGILRNYDSNLLLSATSPYSVIEADEFDRSFHHLSPYIAVITATDPDHLDIYGTEEAYLESFAHFTELIQPGGTLLLHTGLKVKPRVPRGVRTVTYSRTEGDYHAANVRKGNGEIVFDFVTPDGVVADVKLGVPVDINIENAVAAMAVCHMVGVPDEVLREAIGSFLGAKRRFEFWLKEPGDDGTVVIDDYAHHPDELKASIRSVKDLYPHRKLTVVFQPHLYTRTRDFYKDFADSLSLLDEVLLTEIYPAREKPIPGVTSQIIFDCLRPDMKKRIVEKKNLPAIIKNEDFDVLILLGAGDVDDYAPLFTEILKEKYLANQ